MDCAPWLACATSRPNPAADIPEAELSDTEREHVAGLMRVNHAGEVCAQALYEGQALTARDAGAKEALLAAAAEEARPLGLVSHKASRIGCSTQLIGSGVLRDVLCQVRQPVAG